MSSISAGTTSTTTLVHSGDTTGSLVFKTNDTGSGGTTAVTLDTSQNATFAGKVTSAGALTLASNGTTTAVTIDTSQNVGIGTSSPATKLHLNGGTFRVQDSTGSGGYRLDITSDSSSGALNTVDNVPLVFKTNSTERMRIANTGGIALNGTTPPTVAGVGAQNGAFGLAGTGAWGFGIEQATTSAAGGRVLALRNVNDFNNTSNEVIYYVGNTTARFYVVSNGGIYNYQANNSNLSDRREKTNFAPAKPYLDTICAIPVQTFNYIDQNLEEDDGLTLGVVAQDVQAVAPELVIETNWGTQEEPKMRLSIYQTDLQYALMKSIQELKAINDQQAETINALTARVVALEHK